MLFIKTEKQIPNRSSGDNAERVPPLPIPNREVKPFRADDSGFAAKVGCRQLSGLE